MLSNSKIKVKEITFINQNRQRWQEFQSKLASSDSLSPDELGEMYIYITDDLAYSRCYFPDSKTTEFLNSLTARFHNTLYSNKRIEKKVFWDFWTTELPELMWNARFELLLAFSIFVIAFVAGAFSALFDQSYIRAVLGDGYVNKTLHNINSGDPMNIYKSGGSMGMFVVILFNNIKVALFTYALGMLLSFGAMSVVFSNGTMIGAFMSLFWIYGGFRESILTVWMHGAIEISTLIISGCAGILLGKGFLFPGTLRRRQSFVRSARQSGKILLGVLPFITIAAFIEGFITRHTEWPEILRATFILFSLLFMCWYFFVYPWMLHLRTSKNIANGK